MSAPIAVASPVATRLIAGASDHTHLELTSDPATGTVRLRVAAGDHRVPLATLTPTSLRHISAILHQRDASGFLTLPAPPDGHLLLYVERHGETVTLTVTSADEPARAFGPVTIRDLTALLPLDLAVAGSPR